MSKKDRRAAAANSGGGVCTEANEIGKILAKEFGVENPEKIIEAKRQRASEGPVHVRAASPRVHRVKISPQECQSLCKAAGMTYLEGYEKRVFEYVLTDETPDRYGDVVLASGGDLKNYKRNAVVLAFHDGRALPVGYCIKVWHDEVERSIRGWVLFLDERVDDSGFSNRVFNYAANGIMKGGSIGFNPAQDKDGMYRPDEDERKLRKMGPYGMIFAKWELIEYSVTPCPANPSATQKDIAEKIEREGLFTSENVKAARDVGILSDEEMDRALAILDDKPVSVEQALDDIFDFESEEEKGTSPEDDGVIIKQPKAEMAVDIATLRDLRDLFTEEESETMTLLATKLSLICDKIDRLADVVERSLELSRGFSHPKRDAADSTGEMRDDNFYDQILESIDSLEK